MAEAIQIDLGSEDYERRMRQARRRAEWELGDASWAGVIIGAVLYPDADSDSLRAEQAQS